MKAIIATNVNNYIGKDGKLMWHCPQDLAHFKELTEGGRLLCGHNTYIELPPLQNRIVIPDFRGERLVNVAKYDWCIGGKRTYEKYAPYFTELHISFINNNDIGDTMFPDLKNLNENCKIFHYFFGF